MNIKFVDIQLDLIGMGGSMYSLDLTASELRKVGHDVSIITLDPEKNSIPKKTSYKIIEERCSRNPLIRERQLPGILDKHSDGTDVFHVYDPALLAGAGIYRKRGGNVPVVGTLNSYVFCTNYGMINGRCHRDCSLLKRACHSPGPFPLKLLSLPYRLYQQYVSFNLMKNIDMFIAISPAVKRIYSEFGFDGSKIRVVPQPVNLKPGGEPRPENRMKGGRFNILFVGRIERNKGIDVLITAFSKADLPGATLHIVGTGNQEEKLKELSIKLGIKDRVVFYGYVKNERLPFFYSNAQLFVHPGRWPEPMGRTILEAMGFALPLIVSDVGAPGWVSEGASLVFRSENADQLAGLMEKVQADPKLRASLSVGARKRVRQFYYKDVTKNIIKAYSDVIECR